MWYKKSFFKISVAILLVLCIIFLCIQVLPVINYAIIFLTVLLFPVIMALVLYYATRPIRDYLEKKKIPRLAAISCIFLFIFLFISLIVIFIWPTVSQEIEEFSQTPKKALAKVESKTLAVMNLFNITELSNERLKEILIFYLQRFFSLITENITTTIGSVAKIASFFIITPFVLFYFLKDDHQIYLASVKLIPEEYKNSARKILSDADNSLSNFISSQIMVALIIGILIFIGYWAIGLNYAILLAIIAMIFNLIPFCGPFISTIPAVIIGLSISPFMAVKVICVVLIVHLLDLNLISPRIVGSRLQVHPINVILLLVASFSIFGILGAFVIVPLYAIIKVMIRDIYNIHNEEVKEKL